MEEKNKNLKSRISDILRYSIHTWIFRCLITAFAIELVMEILGRRSIVQGLSFIFESPIVYIYNTSIVFFTLLFALFLRKRVFGMIVIGAIWMICGIVNFVVLGFRVTPFAAIDVLMLKDTVSMIDIYFTKWQQVLILIGALLVIAGLVLLFRKTPKFEGSKNVKGTMLACIIAWVFVIGMTNFGVTHNIISDDFANLGMAYKDYGFAYCFTNSIVDNGISKPQNYSGQTMQDIKNELDAINVYGRTKKPNIIYIQLESFFDPKDVAGLTMDKDPVPFFTRLKKLYPSGYLTVPALGAGTANTEFEVLTSIDSGLFGAGEYPYKTTVNETPVESVCSLLKNQGYGAYAIHNNRSSFYDRANVYEKMGFDAFISLEYMYNIEKTSTGWAKDATLVDDIMKCLKDTEDRRDLVYTISVQGHGRYPEEEGMCEEHVKVSYDNPEMENQFKYYVNQIYEMDQMIGNLIRELDKYGEDYVLVLYGDHLPTLELTDEQLPNSNLFQTEYIIVNNIGLELEDKDLNSDELSTRLFEALKMPMGYAQKAHLAYEGADLEEKLQLIAYDMLFGDKYLYNGQNAVAENVMRRGVDEISIDRLENEDDHAVIYGNNFNNFSVVYINDDAKETIYVDGETLMLQDELFEAEDVVTVRQVDKSHHILSSTDEVLYE